MSTIVRYQPLAGQLDGLFDEFFRPSYLGSGSGAVEPAPIRVDVRETPAAYTVLSSSVRVNSSTFCLARRIISSTK